MRGCLFPLLAVPALAVASCAHMPPEPVKVMVPVECKVKVVAEPIYPVVQPGDGLFVRVQKLLAERELRIAYASELKAANAACG